MPQEQLAAVLAPAHGRQLPRDALDAAQLRSRVGERLPEERSVESRRRRGPGEQHGALRGREEVVADRRGVAVPHCRERGRSRRLGEVVHIQLKVHGDLAAALDGVLVARLRQVAAAGAELERAGLDQRVDAVVLGRRRLQARLNQNTLPAVHRDAQRQDPAVLALGEAGGGVRGQVGGDVDLGAGLPAIPGDLDVVPDLRAGALAVFVVQHPLAVGAERAAALARRRVGLDLQRPGGQVPRVDLADPLVVGRHQPARRRALGACGPRRPAGSALACGGGVGLRRVVAHGRVR